MLGRDPLDLRRWIDLAVFLLPDTKPQICGHGDTPSQRTRKTAAFGDGRPTRRERRRTTAVSAGHEQPANARVQAVTSSDGGKSVRVRRCRLEDALHLQGLPPDFLKDAPFTMEGKLKAVANGVCMFTGRAIAKAVREGTR